MAKKKAHTHEAPESPVREKMAFQCNNCKAVFPAGIAGDNDVPLACPHCRAGVHFNPDGTRKYVPENWTKLADLTEAQLAKGHHIHGLKCAHVCSHKGKTKVAPEGIHHVREAGEDLGSKDKA